MRIRLELSLAEAGTAKFREIAEWLAGAGRAAGLEAAEGIGLRVYVHANEAAGRSPWFADDEMRYMERVGDGLHALDLELDDPARFQYRYLVIYDVPLFRKIGRTWRHLFSLCGTSELEAPLPTSFGNRILPPGFAGGVHRDRFGVPTVPASAGPCAFPFRSLVVGADGRCTVCCIDDRFVLDVGDIGRDGFDGVVHGERLAALQRAHLDGRFNETARNAEGIPLCLLCLEWPTPRLEPDGGDKRGAPKPYLTVELSSRCDLACGYCSQKNSALPNRRDLDPAAFERLMDEVEASGRAFENINLFFRGESLLHPDFPRLIGKLREVERKRAVFGFLVLHTNACALDAPRREALLDAYSQREFPSCGNLVISLDAARPETYRTLRGGSLERTEANLRAFLAERATRNQFGPNLILQFVVLEENRAEAGEFVVRWSAELARSSTKPFRVCATLEDMPPVIDSDVLYLRMARTPGEGSPLARAEAARALYLEVVAELGLPLEGRA